MKCTAVQMNPVVGDLVGNTKKILEHLRNLEKATHLVAFPELSITGYPPLDLVLRPGFVDKQMECLERILKFVYFIFMFLMK